MHDLASDLSPTNGWGPQLADNLQAHRSRAEQLLRDHAERARQAELALDEHLRDLARKCDQRDRKLQETERLVAEREQQVRQREEQLVAERKLLEQSRTQIGDLESRFQQQREEADGRQRQMLDQLKSEHEQLEQRRRSLQEQYDQRQQAIEQQRTELDKQRAELEQQRAELQEDRIALAATRASRDEDANWERQLQELRVERDAMAERLREIQNRKADTQDLAAANQTANATEVDETELEELRDDLERAEREIMTLRTRNADLLRQLEPGRHSPSSGELDWEAQKQRLLARLESESNDDDPSHAEDRLTIEGAIRITDEVIAERDRMLAQRDAEIADLKRQLERHSERDADADHDSPSSAESPESEASQDQGESASDERQKLKRMQKAFQDKLRQAEIEISVERAKLARERSDLESKVQMLVSRFGDLEPPATEASAKKSNRGRWLSRLGLSSQEPPAT